MDGAAGEGDTSVMVEGNVSEIAERATEGRRGGSGVILPILLRPPSLPPHASHARKHARSTCEVEAKRGRKKSELLPCCLSIAAVAPSAPPNER